MNFLEEEILPNKVWVVRERMTMRDYFAAKAMPWVASDQPGGAGFEERVAKGAYAIADAMLKARES